MIRDCLTVNLAVALALAAALGAAGCKNASADPAPQKPSADQAAGADAGHTDEPEHDGLPKRVRLSAKVLADAKVRTERVTTRDIAPTVELSGEVIADPDRSARVATPVAGQLVRVLFTEGTTVKKGDALAVVRVAEIGKVRGSHQAATAKAISARSNAARLEALADKGLAAKQEAVSARAEADALGADARAFGEQLSALGMSTQGGGSELILRAPVGGVVLARDAVVGQPVVPEQTIASVADLSESFFLARVFEKDLARVTAGSRAEIALNGYPGERFDGIVEQIGRQVDPVGRTVTARLRLKNRDDMLRVGLFGTASLTVKPGDAGPARAVAVPRSALTELVGKTVVFVRQADDDYEVHEVTTGASAPGLVAILRGLREGEEVVVEGAFTLKSIVLKGTIGEEE